MNERYFQTIDTEDKAYWLGFLYADGHNSTYYGKYFITSIELSEIDKLHLEKFKLALDSTNKLLYREKQAKFKVTKTYKTGISNRNVFNDLCKLGCVPRKSKILKFPTNEQVPDYLIRHFIRGYFDGDGSIHRRTCGAWYAKFTSSYDFITGIKNHLDNLGIFFGKIDKNKGCYSTCTGSRFHVKAVLDYMYNEATIYLDRKFENYKKFLEENREKCDTYHRGDTININKALELMKTKSPAETCKIMGINNGSLRHAIKMNNKNRGVIFQSS